MRRFFITAAKMPVWLYQVAISPILKPSCRFHPTCSAYMLQAIDRHGAFKGLVLGTIRILKCHPWHKKCGTDPVPERFDWRQVIGYKRPSHR